AGRVLIASRTGLTARRAAKDLAGLGAEVEPVPPGGLEGAAAASDVVVNATPLGWDGVSTPIESGFREGCIAVDMVYRPLATPFLRRAAASGCTPVDGLWMLAIQAAENIAVWLGMEASPVELRTYALEAMRGGRG
ncbi:shikimate dehydrogenase, partial [Aeropyrum pernix]